MPKKITEGDMMALAELIREHGFKVYSVENMGNFTFRVVQENCITIFIGQYRGMFVSTHYIHGFPMSPLGEGEMRYQIVL